MFKKIILTALSISVILAFSGCSNHASKESIKNSSTLLVYSGAGLKKPMEEIKTNFEKENDITIEYIYAGSGQLLSQIEASGKGDVLIVGSKLSYETAYNKDIVNKCKFVAYHTPAIIVEANNPKGIKNLQDLTKKELKVVLGDPEANAIGATAKKIIEKNNISDIYNNVVAETSTVNEITLSISSGNADAGIVTKDSAYGNENVEIIEIPEEQNIDQIIPVGTIKKSSNEKEAESFAQYIASDEGKAIFDKYGFKPVKEEENDK